MQKKSNTDGRWVGLCILLSLVLFSGYRLFAETNRVVDTSNKPLDLKKRSEFHGKVSQKCLEVGESIQSLGMDALSFAYLMGKGGDERDKNLVIFAELDSENVQNQKSEVKSKAKSEAKSKVKSKAKSEVNINNGIIGNLRVVDPVTGHVKSLSLKHNPFWARDQEIPNKSESTCGGRPVVPGLMSISFDSNSEGISARPYDIPTSSDLNQVVGTETECPKRNSIGECGKGDFPMCLEKAEWEIFKEQLSGKTAYLSIGPNSSQKSFYTNALTMSKYKSEDTFCHQFRKAFPFSNPKAQSGSIPQASPGAIGSGTD